MKTSKIFVNTLYYGIIPRLTVFANIIILPIITPFLSTYDYGISGVVSSYTDIILAIAPLGLNLYLTNSFYEMPKNYNLVWGRVYYLFVLSGILLGTLNAVVLYFIIPIAAPAKIILCLMGSLPIYTFPSARVAGQLFPYLEKPKPLVFTNLCASMGGLALSFIMIYFCKLGYWGLVANTAFTGFLSFFLFLILLRKYHIRPIIERKWARIKEMLLKGLPLVPHALGFILLANSARIIMSLYNIDYDEIGLFTHGYRMGAYVVIITSAMATALAPQMQTTFRKGDYSNFRKLFYLSQGLAILASFLFCIWMGDIYSILIRNKELAVSSSIAIIMCFAQVLLPFYHFSAVSCFVDRKTSQLLWLVFVPSLLNIILCLVLIPIFGYMAAVYSTIGSYWCLILIPFIIPYHKKWTMKWLGSRVKLLVILLLCGGLLISGIFISSFSIVVRILISVTVLLIFLLVYMSKIKPSLKTL